MKYLLTEKKIKELNERLSFLVNNEIPSLQEAVQEARAQGDLSENAEYHSARENLAKDKAEVHKLEEILQNYEVLTLKTNCDKIEIGSTFDLENVDTGKVNKYTIVGTLETDPSNGFISNICELGAELLGREEGEEFELLLNNKLFVYNIKKIY